MTMNTNTMTNQEDAFNLAHLRQSVELHKQMADIHAQKGNRRLERLALQDALIRELAADYLPIATAETPALRLKESLDYGEWRAKAKC